MRVDSVNYEKKDGVAILTLDEPSKLNALSASIREGIRKSFSNAEADSDIRVIIITGAGDKAFCAGADISGFEFTAEYVKSFIDEVLDVLASGENCKKPVIAAVNGLALGGGLELAIACDFVIASDRAKFGVPEINLGLLPGFAIVRLENIIGRQRAKAMSMLGHPISAQEAKEFGLVLEVVPHEHLMQRAMEMAGAIASKPQMAIKLAKSVYNLGLGGDEVRYAKDAMPFLFMNEDTQEGVKAFREKRKPNFK